ncbi:MAG: FeoB-associated Cys-rich membrane protein [Oscillospiraceae bacterium]|nr:FeoB-associated Cys-rich membrane protein [Oscillospiraceae bacterium]
MNLATIFVLLILVSLVGLALWRIVKKKGCGCGGCTSGCAGCSGSCHGCQQKKNGSKTP